MITAEDFVLELENSEESKNFKLATVAELFENKTAKLQFDGEEVPSEKQYAYLDSYIPKIDDRVLLGVLGGTYVILGKVNYNVSPSTEEEIDRYLFDLKQVIMQKGLSVTGAATFNSGASVVGNIGVNGSVTATNISATGGITASGQLKGGSISTAGSLSAGLTTLSSLDVNGSADVGGNLDVSGTLNVDEARCTGLNHRGSYLGFYGNGMTNKKSVGELTATPTLENLKTKLNSLITALRQYGLIN